jgi:beta-N-acetylhexosaminidase
MQLMQGFIRWGTALLALASFFGSLAIAHPSRYPQLTLDQRIDAYIHRLTPAQQVGQLLMVAVSADGYTSTLNQDLQQWHIDNAVIFTQWNGTHPPTAAGLRTLDASLQAHAYAPMLIATDEEGGNVDRLKPYYGTTPSPAQLAATGQPSRAYQQAALDAERMHWLGLNVDFAPLADVHNTNAIDPSRTFGGTPEKVGTYAGAFLDGLQQHQVAGTLKHWPGLGAATGNPDFTLPTVYHSRAQLGAIDFSAFNRVLPHHPDLIMVTHVLVPAYDAHAPASLSFVLVTQVLRDQYGYGGVVVTDALDSVGLLQYMRQQGYGNAATALGEAAVRAVLAGDDLIEAPFAQNSLSATVAALTHAVATGRITQTRLMQSLHRIIALKVKMGIMTVP